MSTKVSKKGGVRPQCRRHNGEPLTVFSTKHGKCMCLKCAMEQHDQLSDFMPISEAVVLMKSAGKDLIEEITLMTELTKNLKKDRTKVIENLRMSDKSIRAQIRKTRDTLTRNLDIMEQKLSKQLKSIMENSEKANLRDQSKIHNIDAQLKKLKESVVNCIKAGVDIDLVTGVTNEKNAFLQTKHEVMEFQERMPSKRINFKLSPALENFIENVKEFGEISLDSNGNDLDDISDFDSNVKQNEFYLAHNHRHSQSYPGSNTHSPLSFKAHDASPRSTALGVYGNSSRRQANKYGIHTSNPYHVLNENNGNLLHSEAPWRHVQEDENEPFNEDDEGVRDVPVILSAEHDGPCNLTGVAALTSGRLVVCDSKHKCIQLINRQSELMDELVFHYKPCNIASISDDEVVVSFIEKDFVSVYRASLRALRHVRNLSVSGRGGSYSIAFSKNKIAVCRRGEVRVLALNDGELISRIQIDAHFPQIAMSDGGKKIYLSDFVGGKVTCMNELGRTKWEYGQEDLEPCSLAVDLNQLFVADVKGKILIMSTYGILTRVIRCLGHLQALSVDSNTGTLLVTEESSRDKIASRSVKLVAI